jgi:TolB-like protein
METPFPAYRGDEPYIFVCYAHEDADAVFPELRALRDSGINIFYDEGIAPGHEWTQELADAIDGCSQFLYFVSPSSVSSRHCRNEVQYALDRTKTLVSVYLEPTTLPGGLQLSLGSAQAIIKYELGAEDYKRKLGQSFGVSPLVVNAVAASPSNGAFQRSRLKAIAIVAVSALIAGGIWWSSSDGPLEAVRPVQEESPPKLAVLPFVNLSGSSDQEYFSDGVSEDILRLLARQKSLIVRARQSSFFFKNRQIAPSEIAETLDVSYLVDGSVRTQGDQVRVTVRLMDVASNEDIWTNRYDRALADVFQVQDEIAETVAAELGAQFNTIGRNRAVDLTAYDAFLLGRHHYHLWAYDSASQYLLRAIEIEPSYADAHALLARVYATQAWNQPANLQELFELRDRHIASALRFNPTHPLALGLRANSPTYPIQSAIDELHELVSQFPNDEGLLFFYSTKMRAIGRRSLEMAILKRQTAIDPLVAQCPIPSLVANIFYGRLDEANREIKRCENAGVPVPIYSFQIALLEDDLDTARQEVKRSPADWRIVPRFWHPINAAMLAHAENDPEGVQLALSPVIEDIGNQTSYAKVFVALLQGHIENALQHYESALRQGEPLAFYFSQGSVLHRKLFPDFFDTEKYNQLLRMYGLDSESIADMSIPPLPFESP